MNEYHQCLVDSRELLKKLTKETVSIDTSMTEEAKNNINNAIHKLGEIEECCKKQ